MDESSAPVGTDLVMPVSADKSFIYEKSIQEMATPT
jgi:hypothetical protein